ncbi:MAG: EamA family transporter [Verrucomicrobia bacterium]|nr:EamA family transporter [Verrucomicrobiota bacterium]
MNRRKRFPIRLAVGLILAVVIDTALQVGWKTAVSALPDDGSPWINFQALLSNPLSLGVILLMACQFFNWLMVLTKADLSYAQPITSLSYVTVFVLSVVYLKENADAVKIFGIVFILVGVWFISRTDHVTQPQEPEV